MIRTCLLGLILLFTVSDEICGQVNTEKMRLEREKSGISGNVKFEYSVDMGNSELTEIELKPNLVSRFGRHQFFMLNDLSRVHSGGGNIISKAFSHLRYNFHFSTSVIGELFTQAEYNKSLNLEHRYLFGGGLRLIPFNRENVMAALGISAMNEEEKLESGGLTRLVRASSYIYLEVVRGDNFALGNTVYIQPAFEDFDDYRVLDDAELEIWIFKSLAITNSLHYRYDSKPPADLKHYDLEIKNGLKFKF